MPLLNIKASLSQFFPFLARKKGGLPRGEVLIMRPQRRSGVVWELATDEPDSGAILTVARRSDTIGLVLSRVFHLPSNRKVELDEFGAQVWQRCDGAHTVEQLIKFTCETYKLNRRQGEVSVVAFMNMLAQRQLIDFTPEGKARDHDGHGSRSSGRKRPRRN